MSALDTPETLLDRFGRWLARFLEREPERHFDYGPSDKETLAKIMRPGDVLLVEGRNKMATAVKYLTQSTWSHSAFYVGDSLPKPEDGGERPRLIEVNIAEGCVAVPLSKYAESNVRICRPIGLSPEDREQIVAFMIAAIGLKYDTKNVIDLLRYLIPTPPVPTRFRRRLIALGSGDPTRAICSTLIAQAFQSVRYPILPITKRGGDHHPMPSGYSRREILHIRHHSLYAPRDFDLSPYFAIIKPTILGGFSYKHLRWAEHPAEEPESQPEKQVTGGKVA